VIPKWSLTQCALFSAAPRPATVPGLVSKRPCPFAIRGAVPRGFVLLPTDKVQFMGESSFIQPKLGPPFTLVVIASSLAFP